MIVFDIDGTLLPGTSCERLFFQYLLERKILTFRQMFHFAFRGLMLAPYGRSYSLKANKGYMRGLSINMMTGVGKEFFDKIIAGRLSKKGIERLNDHRNKGDMIVLLSGMPEFLLKNIADYLGIEDYRGSVLEVKSGVITGRTTGIFPLSNGKAEIVEELIRKFNVGWSDVTAYGDHYGDRYLLEKVAHPVAVNPDHNLREFARHKGWPIEIFD